MKTYTTRKGKTLTCCCRRPPDDCLCRGRCPWADPPKRPRQQAAPDWPRYSTNPDFKAWALGRH